MAVEHAKDQCNSLDEGPSQPGVPSASKRNLLKAAWVTPVVVAVTLPHDSYAANISGNHSGPKDNKEPRAKEDKGHHSGWFKKADKGD